MPKGAFGGIPRTLLRKIARLGCLDVLQKIFPLRMGKNPVKKAGKIRRKAENALYLNG